MTTSITFENGTRFEGTMPREEEGFGGGVLTFTDGRVYEGEVYKDRPHGQGTLKLLNGDTRTCTWKMGTPDGMMTVTHPDGCSTVFQARNGKAFGKITFHYPHLDRTLTFDLEPMPEK